MHFGSRLNKIGPEMKSEYFLMSCYTQGLGASEKEKKILYNTTRGRTHLLPFF